MKPFKTLTESDYKDIAETLISKNLEKKVKIDKCLNVLTKDSILFKKLKEELQKFKNSKHGDRFIVNF